MDTGEYETNALVINNISSVTFAFYEPVSSTSPSFGASALELESVLRKDGFLACVDTVRRGLWCFRLSRKDELQGNISALPGFPKTVTSAGCTLSRAEEGGFEPAGLVKNRPNAVNTPSSSSSSGSAIHDPAYRSAQSASLPSSLQSFPNPTNDQESRTAVSTESKPSSSASIKDVYEHFICAALSAISANFCAKTNAIPLSSRTLLLPRVVQDDDCDALPAVLASLRIYLATAGSLVITLSLSPAEGIINLPDALGQQMPPLGVTVLAAPLGVFATCQPITITETTATEASLGQSPDTQVVRLRPDKGDGPWRSVCSKLIEARSIPYNFSGPQKWIGLQRMRRRPTEQSIDGKRTPMSGAPPSMSWPANLCFCKMFSKLAIKGETEDHSSSQLDQNFDTLKLARQWFLDAGERDEALAKNKRERDAVRAHETSLADGQAQNPRGLSPLALRRASNTGAAPVGGMYPTPPDQLQNLVGATPSGDDAVSSPGNNATASAMVDMGTAPNLPSEAYSDNWENPEAKRERIGNSFDSENLFGELGPDMFGDADITEADFNFFDQQPDDVGLGSLDIPDIPNADASLGLTVGLPTAQEPHIKPDPTEVPLAGAPPSPIFTKPELRHARSSLGEDARRQTGPDAHRLQSAGIKRPSSPFNPDTVYKRIRASLDNHKAVQKNSLISTSQHGSIFHRVEFGPSLSMVNSKYQGSGRFDFSIDRSRGGANSSDLNAPPTTNYLRRHGKGRKGLKELPTKVGQLLCNPGHQDPISNRASPSNMEETHSDADEMSLTSDQDDSSYDSDEPASPVKSLSLRRRRIDDDGESLATSFREIESVDLDSPHLPFDLPRAYKFEVELPLTRYFADAEPPWIQYSLPDDQLIMAAQTLTDQFSTCTLPISQKSQSSLQSTVDRRHQLLYLTRKSTQQLQAALPPCLTSATGCQFRPFIEIQDGLLLGQPLRMQPRPPPSDQTKAGSLFPIASPHFELRRYESKLSVLPSAVAFWESLGLSPSPGNKDINAICIFPDYEGLADGMLVFTDRMRSIYESLKLGSFNRLPTSSSVESGMFPFEVERDAAPLGKPSSFLGPSLANCASKVCKVLSSTAIEETNFVIFFVYSPEVAGSIVECCAVFNEIFDNYKRVLSNKKMPIINDLALQLVPQDFVASSSTLAMPSPLEFARLALETYDRCTRFGGDMPAPAIVLEQLPPRVIDFKVSMNPSHSLIHENTCLHIAYAQSIDGRWITAAWTDTRGSNQMTASYCLGRKGKSLSTHIADVAREIWESTYELISNWKVHWKIIIAKSGVMEQHEIEMWSNIAQAESRASIMLTLLAVDTDPSLQLLPPEAKVPGSATSIFYTTPASTPQGSMLSPEQSGNPPTPVRDNAGAAAATPAGDHSSAANNNATDSDADATLADPTDATWGAVLAHRLSNAAALTELQPALASGYLVKRGGTRAEDAPAVLEVNVLVTGNLRAFDLLLKEILVQFRGLGTLARARGMVDRETDVRPWHVAAAEKAVRALYMLM
ncbi:mediator complex subunit 13 C-terminal-domain-containing protein [Whalleya microplaca]|nr:mediator complex subunit 13 C-terminal-domain-containing protein [Whalleya microplaca]